MQASLRTLVAVSFLTLVAGANAAFAQEAGPNYISVGPRAGIELRDSHGFIGAEARFGLLQIVPSVRLDLRPVFNYYFISDVTVWDLAGEAIFAFDIHQEILEPYALAGLNIGHAAVSTVFGTASDTRVGLNLGGGVTFLQHQKIRPFAELRFTVGDYDPILLTGGVLFVLK